MRKNKLSFIALSVAGILSSFHINASGNIIIDNNKKIDLAVEIKNGIEHINIEKADKKGVSHNYYQKFNVSEKGVVIQNPTYLTNPAAKLIINEVTSNEKSFLKGNLKINGHAAKLIITNPYGIECDGCSVSGVSKLLLKSRYAEPVSMNVEGWGAAEGKFFTAHGLPSGSNQIVIKNISQPIIANGTLVLDTNNLNINDGIAVGNNAIINSDYLSIGSNAKVKFDKLVMKINGNIDNYGKLNANNLDIDVKEDFINHRGARLQIAGKNSHKLTDSHFKANKLKFDHASFDVSNTQIKFDNNEFDSLNSEINFKNSIVTINSNKFSNENDYRKNDQHHIDRKLSYGFISFENTKLAVNSNEIVNKAVMRGDGRLEIKTNSYIGRNNIKIEGEKTTKIGQHAIKKNGVAKITANKLLDTSGSYIAASNGLIVNAQQLKAKDGDIKIINKNKNIKPVVYVAELINVKADESWKFANSNKINFYWKEKK